MIQRLIGASPQKISLYHAAPPQDKSHYQFLMKWIKDNVSPQESILEVGCGSGLFGLWLNREGYPLYTGVDINRNLVDIGRKATGINLIFMDGRRLDFEDDSFDMVGYMNNFFEEDTRLFVKEGLRVSRKWLEFDGCDAEYLLDAGKGTYGYKYLPKRDEILEWIKGHEILVDTRLNLHRHLYIVKI